MDRDKKEFVKPEIKNLEPVQEQKQPSVPESSASTKEKLTTTKQILYLVLIVWVGSLIFSAGSWIFRGTHPTGLMNSVNTVAVPTILSYAVKSGFEFVTRMKTVFLVPKPSKVTIKFNYKNGGFKIMSSAITQLLVVAIALVPFCTGLTQGVKIVLPKLSSRFYPVVSITIGIGLGAIASVLTAEYTMVQLLIAGGIAGMASCGLYDIVTTTSDSTDTTTTA